MFIDKSEYRSKIEFQDQNDKVYRSKYPSRMELSKEGRFLGLKFIHGNILFTCGMIVGKLHGNWQFVLNTYIGITKFNLFAQNLLSKIQSNFAKQKNPSATTKLLHRFIS